MFNKIDSPDNVIASVLSDKLSAADMQQYESVFRSRLEKPGKFGLCVDFTGLSDITAQGAMEGAKADLEFFRHITRFERFALVSDKEWPGVIVGLIKSLLPTLECKQFMPNLREQAVQWVSEAPPTAAHPKGSMRLLKTSKEDVFAFEIDGVLTAEAVAGVLDDFVARLGAHDKVRLLAHIKSFGGVDLSILMQGGLVSMKLDALKKLERYAVVGAPAWMTKMIEAVGPMLPGVDMRTFVADQEADAWAWVGAQRA